ncbi:glucose-6-phosphate isomerase [Microbacterium sp. C7(2022)]|uniref:glucose-6-phosphate isomerase n=1 Tax=Microbacterium sp. C7(2022) TaxID=2992759 RepID=UPI00237A1F27|nr:glucose-6-phosphate isomerase [Microbacterium sp. C7(2022)]MDE0546812.1 glucose-6-phosphate isomerase [Microbacterium sp. C7(2022)]
MTFAIHLSGHVKAVVDATLPALTSSLVASGITAGDASLWGSDAETEAAQRLGWVEAVSVSRPLVPEIVALRESLSSRGVTRIVLAGMGGSSLAPEVITRTAGVPLVVLDSTSPGQVLAALDGDESGSLAQTALVVASKSGSTVETDSAKRAFEAAFRDLGIDPVERIVVVTDPGSPMETAARADGYTVFTADPTVGGRYSALTAFGLVPSGLAGADISELLDEAEASMLEVAIDSPDNPALVLAAAIAGGGADRRDKLGLVTDGTHIVGLPDWIEQLVAESTGKAGTGILPVVLLPVSPELDNRPADLQIVRLVDEANEFHLFEHHEGEVLISGSLGAQFIVWEYATAIAGRMLGINPFDQPDVESAKTATRGLLEERPEPTAPAFVVDGVEVRSTDESLLASGTIAGVLDALWAQIPDRGYVAVQAYVDRLALPQLQGLRELVAADSGRPTTFGWGPRFLHSTGQFHKGGPATGVFLQIVEQTDTDVEIPGRPFTFGELIRAQAAGDAAVLAASGRPVVTLTLTDPQIEVLSLFEAAQ